MFTSTQKTISRSMTASGWFATFTLWSSKPALFAGIIITILHCILSRIGWRENTNVHTTGVPVSTRTKMAASASTTSSTELTAEEPPLDGVDTKEKDTQDAPLPTKTEIGAAALSNSSAELIAEPVVEPIIEPVIESTAEPASASTAAPTIEERPLDVDVKENDSHDVPYPTIEPFHPPSIETTPSSGNEDSCSLSVSSTTSLFDQHIPHDRASTPDTEINDDENFPKSTAKNDYEGVETDSSFITNSITPPIETPSQCSSKPTDAIDNREAMPPPAVVRKTSVSWYSMKPAELVGAVEDFSVPIPITPRRISPTIVKPRTNDDYIMDPLLLSAKKRIAPPSAPTNNPANKKQKPLSPRRRRQADRQLAN